MPLTLTVIDGPVKGRAFTFDGPGTFIVGRSSRAQFQFPSGPDADLRISHTHFMVEVNLPLCRLHDLNSHNHTYVNGAEVTFAELKAGDRIKAGQSIMRVDLPSEPLELSTTDWPNVFELPTIPPGPSAAASVLARRKSCPVCRQPATDTADRLCTMCRETAATLPQMLPGYIQVRELGRGHMGVVTLALRQADARVFAIKTIAPAALIKPNQIARFLREAEILKQLDHPHIVRFHEMGVANSLLFLVMEHVRGNDIQKLVKPISPLRVRPAVRLVCQLCQALEYAHKLRIVHRDIKPSNILLHRGADKKQVKVADFGLARVYQASQLSGLTLQGDVGGTPAYMAPEQILDFRNAMPAADQYSVAATLYYLLTGKTIYDMPKAICDQLAMILDEDPVSIRQRRRDLPNGLVATIHRALSRNPNDRFPEIRAFRKALMRFAT